MARASALSPFRGSAGLHTAYLKLLFDVKCRANVANGGGAPVSAIEKILARIRALFASTAQVPPSREVEETAAPPATVSEVMEPRAPEPEAVAVPAERPLAAESPATTQEPLAVAQQPLAIAVETPAPIEEAPTEVGAATTGGVTLRLETERGSRSMFQVTKSGATIGR